MDVEIFLKQISESLSITANSVVSAIIGGLLMFWFTRSVKRRDERSNARLKHLLSLYEGLQLMRNTYQRLSSKRKNVRGPTISPERMTITEDGLDTLSTIGAAMAVDLLMLKLIFPQNDVEPLDRTIGVFVDLTTRPSRNIQQLNDAFGTSHKVIIRIITDYKLALS